MHQFKSREEAMAVLGEVLRYKPEAFPTFVDESFPQQAMFVKDDNPRVAGLCTRRAGKSYGIGLKSFRACFLKPGTTALYVGLTRMTAKDIMWQPVIKHLNKKLNLGGEPNETELTMTFPNESRIKLVGMDKDEREMHKVLGQAPSLVIIDEAGSFRVNLEQICYEMIEPALTDNDGTLALVGTPTDLLGTLFHKVTKDGSTEYGWNTHKWNTTQNPYIAEKWAKRLEMLIHTNPRVVETPGYQRMYLGKWVEDLDKIVYKFDPNRNEAVRLPDNEEFTYTLGVDLGFNDDTAFSLGAYGEYDPNYYVVEVYKEKHMIFTAVAEKVREYMTKYPVASVVIDGANKQGVEEMRARYNIPFQIAEKTGKVEFIGIMNADFTCGRIKLLPKTESLKAEYRGLIWDDQAKLKKIEHPSCDNHLADATLYAYRHALQYLSQPRPKEHKTDEEKIDEWLEQESAKLERQADDGFQLEDLSEARFSDEF